MTNDAHAFQCKVVHTIGRARYIGEAALDTRSDEARNEGERERDALVNCSMCGDASDIHLTRAWLFLSTNRYCCLI